MLSIYTIAQLVSAAKAQIRSLITGAATETGSDHALIADVAARLLQGIQVAGKHIYDQVLPGAASAYGKNAADAATVEWMLANRGIDLSKGAVKARGYLIIFGANGYTLPGGSTIVMPSTFFIDGIERTYVTLSDVTFRSADTISTHSIRTEGSSDWVLHVARNGAIFDLEPGKVVMLSTSSFSYGYIKRADKMSSLVELAFSPMNSAVFGSSPDTDMAQPTINSKYAALVPVEALEAGTDGNAGWTSFTPGVDLSSQYASLEYAVPAFIGGGKEAISTLDPLDPRNIRMLEDNIAAGASLGNMQHLREMALTCPDVAMDDVVVYRGLRGPTSVDVVPIGHSYRTSIDFDSKLRAEFVDGVNGRIVGDLKAQQLQDYLLGEGDYTERLVSYYDDVRVVSLEIDYTGRNPAYDVDFDDAQDFARTVIDLDITVTPQPGYGPDAGTNYSHVPYTVDSSNPQILYTEGATTDVNTAVRVGDRVWVARGENPNKDTRRGYITSVERVVSLPSTGYTAVVPVFDVTGIPKIPLEWGAAGPLTQPIIDAVFDYFDGMGPGSYRVAPKDPGYLREFFAAGTDIQPEPGQIVERWPPEDRRWPAGFRASELRARILAIPGVASVSIPFADCDPRPLKKLFLRGVKVRYA